MLLEASVILSFGRGGGGLWYHFLSGPMFFLGGMRSFPFWSHVPPWGMMSLPFWSHVPSGGMMSLPFWSHVPSEGMMSLPVGSHILSRGGLPQGVFLQRSNSRHCSARYAPYWNAFLFYAVVGQNWPNNRWSPLPPRFAPPTSGTSWIRHCRCRVCFDNIWKRNEKRFFFHAIIIVDI